jgi:mannose-1-phosphate guanylyltransferase
MGSDADWIDAGTPAAYLAANLRYKDGAGEGPATGSVLAPGASVIDSVLGAGVTVGEGAIVAASVCFDGAFIAPGSEVRRSVVGRGARIEAGAVVTDLSLVGDGATVPAGARLSAGRTPAP